MIEKISTGITGLDEILDGGFPKERTILIAGPAGSGKSTFGLGFLVHGVMHEDEPGIYVSFDESLDNVRNDALSYGWDLKALEDQNLLAMIDGFSERAGLKSPEKYTIELEVDELLHELIRLIDSIGAERVVIDSITALALGLEGERQRRKQILKLSAVMSALTCTTLMVSEMREDKEISRFGIEEFMAQGVVVIKYKMAHSGRRSLQVRKMRGVKHSMREVPFIMSSEGLFVYPDENIYGDF